MTEQQAADLLVKVADLQQQGQAIGMLLGQVRVWLEVACLLLMAIVFFTARRRA